MGSLTTAEQAQKRGCRCRDRRATRPYEGRADTSRWVKNTFAEQAKACWGLWDPLGEPVVRGIEAWAEMQRAYLLWLRQTYGTGSRP